VGTAGVQSYLRKLAIGFVIDDAFDRGQRLPALRPKLFATKLDSGLQPTPGQASPG